MAQHCAEVKKGLWTELRLVSKEVGGYEVARRLPTEQRRWWLEQMRKEIEQAKGHGDGG